MGKWPKLLLVVAFLLAAPLPRILGAPVPQVALLYGTYDNSRHSSDYDAKMRQLGWPFTKYANTELTWLAEGSDRYDIILAGALFRYRSNVDFGAQREMWLRFMERGGALVLTDCNYAEHLEWLRQLGPGFAASVAPAAGGSSKVTQADAQHPLLNTPNRLPAWGDFWSGMKLSSDYQVLIRAPEGARLAIQPVGKGFLLLSSYWGFNEQMLENIWAFTQCRRAGIQVTLPDLAGAFLGSRRLAARVRNTTGDARQVSLELTLTGEAERRIQARSAVVTIPAGAEREVPLSLALRERGSYQGVFTLRDADGKLLYESPPQGLVIPPLFSTRLISPTYRRSVYLAAPPAALRFGVILVPDKEKLKTLSLRAALTQNDKTVRATTLKRLTSTRFTLDVPARGLAPGAATVNFTLTQGRKTLARSAEPLRVVGEAKPQVLLDAQGATQVDGQPFFPIGIYHIPAAKLAQAKEMGFNTAVGWGVQEAETRRFLDTAEAAGLKVILEMSPLVNPKYNPEALRAQVRRFRDHPALLTWYTVDEPPTVLIENCRNAWQLVQDEDPNHPVYLVMCRPEDFASFGKVTDILAVDPYPIPGPVNLVASWMSQAAAGDAPVWLIPQLHNWSAYSGNAKQGRAPTAEEERNMVYQGLIYGAKGIVYYPWDDGPCGLVHEPALMAALPRINAELQQLGPLLLHARRTLLAAEPAVPPVHAALFEGQGERLVLIASGTSKEATVRFSLPGIQRLQGVFNEPPLSVQDGRLSLTLRPLEVRVYRVAQ